LTDYSGLGKREKMVKIREKPRDCVAGAAGTKRKAVPRRPPRDAVAGLF
jgi:hypothetical protein